MAVAMVSLGEISHRLNVRMPTPVAVRIISVCGALLLGVIFSGLNAYQVFDRRQLRLLSRRTFVM